MRSLLVVLGTLLVACFPPLPADGDVDADSEAHAVDTATGVDTLAVDSAMTNGDPDTMSPACRPACQHGGSCGDTGACICDGTGYMGAACETPVCPAGCAHGGACVAPETCLCSGTGYGGARCMEPLCSAACANGGACSAPDTCDCTGTGFAGPTCAEPVCNPGCGHAGLCTAPNTCDCAGTGYTGVLCDTPDCIAPCQQGGVCVAPDTCACAGTGYSGPTCAIPLCSAPCQHGGVCVAPDKCDCAGTGYAGASCTVEVCGALGPCAGGFVCTDHGTCESIASGEVWVPLGSFWMGCNVMTDDSCFPREHSQHEVGLPAYAVDKFEVTVAEYASCVAAGVCAAPSSTSAYRTYGVAGKEAHPVNVVDWSQAADFCTWPGKPAGVQRLCTEAEWERAARGGCETLAGPDCRTMMRRYPWGAEEPGCGHAVFRVGGVGGALCEPTDYTRQVGGTPQGASPYGAYDMSGNLSEWVSDWYLESLPAAVAIAPTGPDSGTERVYRGGSWIDVDSNVRGGLRAGAAPTTQSPAIGFRCCRSFP